MNIHLERIDRGFYIVMIPLIIVLSAILGYALLSWMTEAWQFWIFLLGSALGLMYLFGFVAEKIRKVATKEEKL